MADLEQASSPIGLPPRPEPDSDFLVNERAQVDREVADDAGLTDAIKEAAARAKTPVEIEALLGDRLSFLSENLRADFISNVQAMLRRDGDLDPAPAPEARGETAANRVPEQAAPEPDPLPDAAPAPDNRPPEPSPRADSGGDDAAEQIEFPFADQDAKPPASPESRESGEPHMTQPVDARPEAPIESAADHEPPSFEAPTAAVGQATPAETPTAPTREGPAAEREQKPHLTPAEQMAAFDRDDHLAEAPPVRREQTTARAAADIPTPPDAPERTPDAPPRAAAADAATERLTEVRSMAAPASDAAAKAASATIAPQPPVKPAVVAAAAQGVPVTERSPANQQDDRGAVFGPTNALGAVLASLRRPKPVEQPNPNGASAHAAASAPRALGYIPTPDGAPAAQTSTPAGALINRLGVYHRDRRQPVDDARTVAAAEHAGERALASIAAIEKHEASSILNRIRDAAEASGGMDKVLSEMRPGGAFEDLRKQFNAVLAKEDGFSAAYDNAVGAVADYAKQRGETGAVAKARPATSLARLEDLDRQIVQAADKLPGREPGKSALDEAMENAKDLFKDAVNSIRGAFSRNSDQNAQNRPAPSPGLGR